MNERASPDEPAHSSRGARAALAVVLCAAAVVFFHGLGVMPLQEPDEGRYAEIAREIAAPGGDWLTPHLDGIRYFEKPPLYFWTLAAVFRLLGPSEASARLVSALSMLLAAAGVAWMARRSFGPRADWLAAAIFCSCPLVLLLSHIVLVDTLLLVWLTGALAALARAALRPDPAAAVPRPPVLAFYLCAALATLTKGPIGLAIPGAAVVVWLAFSRDWKLLRGLARPEAVALYLLLAAPWFVLMELRNPGYLHAFFVEQNLGRLTTGGRFNRQGPLWYYLPVLLGAAFPWSLLGAVALWRGWRTRAALWRQDRERRAVRFFAAAFAGPLLLLSIANSKLPYYALPLLPPVAILVAWAVCRGLAMGTSRRTRAVFAAFGSLLLLGGLGAIALGLWGSEAWFARWVVTAAEGSDKAVIQRARASAIHAALVPLGAGLLLLALAVFGAAAALRRRGPVAAAAVLAAALGAGGLVFPYAAAPFGTFYSHRDLALALRPLLREDDEVLFYRSFRRTIPFYLGRTVTLWHAAYNEFGHEVDPGAEPRGKALQSDRERLRALLGGPRRVFVVITGDKRRREIEALSPRPLREVVRIGTKMVLLSEPPAQEDEG